MPHAPTLQRLLAAQRLRELGGRDWLATQPQGPSPSSGIDTTPLYLGPGERNPYDQARRAEVMARAEKAEASDREAMPRAGLRQMGQLVQREGLTPKTRSMIVGKLLEIGIPPSDDVLQEPPPVQRTWVNRAGSPARLSEAEIQSGDRPYADGEGGSESGMRALAALTARSGQLPEGTPTQRGEIMQGMASDPELMAQYERTRMEPIRAQAQIMQTALDDLLTTDNHLTPGAQAIFGEYTPVFTRGMGIRADTVAANAALRQIVGQRVVDLIREMKGQSQTGATGFGQLNRSELDIILSAATRLTQRLPEAEAQEELKILREKLTKVLQPSAVEAGTSAGTAGGGGFQILSTDE